jgi:hypothetical protein
MIDPVTTIKPYVYVGSYHVPPMFCGFLIGVLVSYMATFLFSPSVEYFFDSSLL